MTFCNDHLNNTFVSEKDMCKAYKVPYHIFKDRYYRRQWSLKRALLTPISKEKKRYQAVYDHKGNKFDSLYELCKEYCITVSLYNSRLNEGWPLEKILTTPPKRITYKDIKGIFISSFNNKHYYNCSSKKWKDHKLLTLEEIRNM